VLIGIAKPTLPLGWNAKLLEPAVIMPTTAPDVFTRAPPESPGSIPALVSMSPLSRSLELVSSSLAVIDWLTAMTDPLVEVGVPPTPPALPRATTAAPTFTICALAIGTVFRPEAPFSLSTATSAGTS